MFAPPTPLLLASQRRQIFEVIRSSGLDPHDFELSDSGSADHDGQFAEVVHRSTGFYIRIYENDLQWAVQLSPAPETRAASTKLGGWDAIVVYSLNMWLTLLERELDAGEDPWEQIKREREIVAAEPDDIENTPFNSDERLQISTQLREIKEYLHSTQDLAAEQMFAIESRLEYLDEAAGRMGRVDWRNTFVGVMLGLVVEAVVPPAVVREVLSLALRSLSHLFGGALPELPPG